MTQKITSIEKGWGEDSTYYSTNTKLPHDSDRRVDNIQQEQRSHFIGESDSGCVDIIVYRGYRTTGCVFEMESGSGITLTFWEDKQ